MSVILHEPGLRVLLNRPSGPLGRYIERKAAGVDIRASNNATGRPGPEMRTTDLASSVRQISVRPFPGAGGVELQSDVIADARHGGFQYPVAQELGGTTPQGARYRYPFLEPALAAEFNQSYKGASNPYAHVV